MIAWLLAAVHLLALGIGFGAVWGRAAALRGELDRDGLRRVFRSDTWWGVAGLLWILTGLLRAFGGFEKGTTYYLENHLFWGKMLFLVILLGIEIYVGIGLTRWRAKAKRNETPDLPVAGRYATLSVVQAGLVVSMLLAATAMTRGFGMVG